MSLTFTETPYIYMGYANSGWISVKIEIDSVSECHATLVNIRNNNTTSASFYKYVCIGKW